MQSQLMPLNWCMSFLMILLLLLVMMKMYFYKNEEMKLSVVNHSSNYNWMW